MKLSHLNKRGEATMVDVSLKAVVLRKAEAAGTVLMQPATIALISKGKMKKGDVLACARIAGIMAAKKTAELIPLCHTIPIEKVSVEIETSDKQISIRCAVVSSARTGVEMEALSGVSVAALTLYDMCKAVDKEMVITDIRLISKSKEVHD